MQTCHQIEALRAQVATWRHAGARIAFVPTMGNLHRGHLFLVEEANRLAAHSVVSIFVNPLQFGPNEDFQTYPRTLEADRRQLKRVGPDLLFVPSAAVMYPRGTVGMTRVEVPGLSALLCGASRPGHFAGMATVVTKLLNIVQPDVALFGEKDWQQLVIIRRLVADLNLPVSIAGVPTVRESDGLAMSSRNQYLSASEREMAPLLYAMLQRAAAQLIAGDCNYQAIEATAREALTEAGWRPDYFTIRRAEDLGEPGQEDTELRILAAAWLGRARLIDNCPVTLPQIR